MNFFLRRAISSAFAISIAAAAAGCAIAPETPPADIAPWSDSTKSTDAEHSAPAPAPSIHAGDQWTDRLMGGDRKFIVGAAKTDGTYFVDQWGNQTATTADLNVKTWRSLTSTDASPKYFDPPMKWFDFPLEPGKKWHQTSKWSDPAESKSGTIVTNAIVGQWEKIAVPAGTYEALRVDVACRMSGRGDTADQITLSYWWVPSVNRFVKYSYRGSSGAVDAELISYQPAK
jgi:hypothetical protein